MEKDAIHIHQSDHFRSADKTNGKSYIHMAGGRPPTAQRSDMPRPTTIPNETTAIPEFLKTLEIKGCVVTSDTRRRA